jgi:hypothetical protein
MAFVWFVWPIRLFWLISQMSLLGSHLSLFQNYIRNNLLVLLNLLNFRDIIHRFLCMILKNNLRRLIRRLNNWHNCFLWNLCVLYLCLIIFIHIVLVCLWGDLIQLRFIVWISSYYIIVLGHKTLILAVLTQFWSWVSVNLDFWYYATRFLFLGKPLVINNWRHNISNINFLRLNFLQIAINLSQTIILG